MSVVDVERLLQAVPGDDPCGPSLDGDPDFLAMEKASQGKPEKEFGTTVIPAEPPDWKTVRKNATGLLARTKDLRVGVFLAQALLQTDGFAGFADGLDVVHGLLVRYWDGVHPKLDPEDNDPTWRVNVLTGLTGGTIVQGIRQATMVVAPPHGRFSLRDLELASGELAPRTGEEPPNLGSIDAAFRVAPRQDLEASSAAIARALAQAGAIDTLLTEKVGAGESLDLSGLAKALGSVQTVYAAKLGISSPEGTPRTGVTEAGATSGGGSRSGEISSLEDVARFIDRACDYFSRNEPSSPVPLLLRRAKRLMGKDFMTVVRDLAPDGLSQVEIIRGAEPD